MKDRKYVAISIKHTEHRWKFGKPCVLWGYKQTADDEERCFADYTMYLSKAERYALGEFQAHGYSVSIVKPEPISMSVDFCKRWKNYDTVLVDANEYADYCKMCCLATELPKEELK